MMMKYREVRMIYYLDHVKTVKATSSLRLMMITKHMVVLMMEMNMGLTLCQVDLRTNLQ